MSPFVSLKAFAGLIASLVVLVTGWFGLTDRSPTEPPTFGAVLDRTLAAETFELRRVRQETTQRVLFARNAGAMRWEESPERYRIVRSDAIFSIDETQNAVARSVEVSELLSEGSPRPEQLLGLTESDIAALRKLEPTRREPLAGRRAYRYETRIGERKLIGHADVATGRLIRLQLFDDDNRDPEITVELIAMNDPIDENEFVISDSLTADGRIGKVMETAGLVTIKPLARERWTPVLSQMVLKPGDWVRVNGRGANAASVSLTTPVRLTLGPGSLIECVSPSEVRLHSGPVVVDVTGQPTEPFTIGSGKNSTVAFDAKGRTILTLDHADHPEKARVRQIKNEPDWLAGFEGTATTESLGSLVVEIDGRNEPLTVGTHLVNVEIRDQIARTTIEETFVNHTDRRLEGVFHFPLPQDASISGFGMWIGDELVEADVVEKQRAREIYETILREKRDPGLLEWAGGNQFKARVFPIEPHSDKRIKITYTQVLPLRGNRFRYAYALDSELLRTKPLENLSISVRVSSALPLASIGSPTHITRDQLTANAGRVEFTARNFTPDRDFEVVCELAETGSDVVVIPHRRGNDGYLLAQIMPPKTEGDWEREILPDGNPLELTLLLDTSASMDAGKREEQREFVETVLASLSERDRIRIAVTDVETTWLAKSPAVPDDKLRERVMMSLNERISLGWTDLDRAFGAVESVMAEQQSKRSRHVVYIGDGLLSVGEADPFAFLQRVERMFGAGEDKKRLPSFHAIGVGNTTDATVLRGLSNLGGGSVREIAGGQTPTAVATEFLNEIAQSGLRDLKVEFEGVRVAAVYPEPLPNVAAGTQQILVGRYLPGQIGPDARMILTGTFRGEPIRREVPLGFDQAESGNSFIPRLWARKHLDHLLARGSDAATRKEIIAMSAEFHIITPFTSLLVLESDEDRERFGVKRRFEMRDGERFFAEGRKDAETELRRQQMKLAGNWRIGLRRQMLHELSTLGRQPLRGPLDDLSRLSRSRESVRWGGSNYHSGNHFVVEDLDDYSLVTDSRDKLGREAWRGRIRQEQLLEQKRVQRIAAIRSETGFVGGQSTETWYDISDGRDVNGNRDFGFDGLGSTTFELSDIDGDDRREPFPMAERGKFLRKELDFFAPEEFFSHSELIPHFASDREAVDWTLSSGELFGEIGESERGSRFGVTSTNGRWISDYDRNELSGFNGPVGHSYSHRRLHRSSAAEFLQLFPSLAGAPAVDRSGKVGWPNEVREVTDQLETWSAVKKSDTLLAAESVTTNRDVRWDRETSRSASVTLWSADRWLTAQMGAGADAVVEWCDMEYRGIYSATFGFGRRRNSEKTDLSEKAVGLDDLSHRSLAVAYSGYDAKVVSRGDGQVTLRFTPPGNSNSAVELLVDTERNVVLQSRTINEEKPVSIVRYQQHVEVAGRWWPTEIVTEDAEGNVVRRQTQSVTELNQKTFDDRFTDRFAGENGLVSRDRVVFLNSPLPEPKVALDRIERGVGTVTDHLVVLFVEASAQDWEQTAEALNVLTAETEDAPAIGWLREIHRSLSRDHSRLLDSLIERVRALAATPRRDEWVIASRILGLAYPITGWHEYSELLRMARPIAERQPTPVGASEDWDSKWLTALNQRSMTESAFEHRVRMAERYPWNLNHAITVIQELTRRGRWSEATQRIEALKNREPKLTDGELERVYVTHFDLLLNRLKFDEAERLSEEWITAQPNRPEAYRHRLEVLVRTDRMTGAGEIASGWLRDAVTADAGDLTDAERTRASVAIEYLLGNFRGLNWNQMDPRWMPQLDEAVRGLVVHRDRLDLAGSILDHSHYRRQSRSGEEQPSGLPTVEDVLWTTLRTAAKDWDSAEFLRVLSWYELASGTIDNDERATLVPLVRKRWSEADEFREKTAWDKALITLYQRQSLDAVIRFLREALKTGPATYRESVRTRLVTNLQAKMPSRDRIPQIFVLLIWETNPQAKPQLLSKLSPHEQIVWQSRFARDYAIVRNEFETLRQFLIHTRLIDFVFAKRKEPLAENEVEAREEAITAEVREEILELMSEWRNRWAKLAEEAPADTDRQLRLREFSRWTELDIGYLRAADPTKTNTVLIEDWKVLDGVEWDFEQASETEPDDTVDLNRQLRELRIERRLVRVIGLTVRKVAADRFREKLLKLLQRGASEQSDRQAMWRGRLIRLRIALDQPVPLEASLRNWITEGGPNAPGYRLLLGRLLAERGDIKAAVVQFETVAETRELSPSDSALLVTWELVLGREKRREKTEEQVVEEMPTDLLARMISNAGSQIRNRSEEAKSVPLEDELLIVIDSYMQRAPEPSQLFSTLGGLYRVSGDFRTLRSLPHAVLGRTPGSVYGSLSSIDSILREIHKEATTDEVIAVIGSLRQTDDLTALDRRALDLLMAQVRRRAARVLNQPGPHIDAAADAMQRAFDRDWQRGERVHMAAFLDGLGDLPDQQLSAEQLRELRQLHAESEIGSDAGLTIARHFARRLFYAGELKQREEAIRVLRASIDAHKGQLSPALTPAFSRAVRQLVDFLIDQRKFADAEGLLRELIQSHYRLGAMDGAGVLNNPLTLFADDRQLVGLLWQVYTSALVHGGQTTLGKGHTHYPQLRDQLLRELGVTTRGRQTIIRRLNELFRLGDSESLPQVKLDLRRFAFDVYRDSGIGIEDGYPSMTETVASTIDHVLSPVEALRFLLARHADHPQRFSLGSHSAWRQFGDDLARYRYEADDEKLPIPKGIEERLLTLVLDQLRVDLNSGPYAHRAIYEKGYTYFWHAQADQFFVVAEDVFSERIDDERVMLRVAGYVYDDLNEYARAIELLFEADTQGKLNRTGKSRLVDWLFGQDRPIEAIPVLQELIAGNRFDESNRLRLIEAYSRSGRTKQARQLFDETERLFREQNRWNQEIGRRLAEMARVVGFHADAVRLADEWIATHLRGRPAPRGDSRASSMFQLLADAHSELGQTRQAMEAASSAVVLWPSDDSSRANAMQTLERVLKQADDLSEFAKEWMAEVERTGQDSPLIRKLLGQVFLERKEFENAVTHLRAARELSPADRNVSEHLVTALDELGRGSEGTDVLLDLADIYRSDFDLYRRIHDRLRGEQPELAERAATSIVEAAPAEAESHEALARIYEQADRWNEAVPLWKRTSELRALEPTGLLGYARALLETEDRTTAREVIKTLTETEWPERFDEELKQQLPKLRGDLKIGDDFR